MNVNIEIVSQKRLFGLDLNGSIVCKRASAEKFPGGWGGESQTEKRPKNSTIKPLSTISVPCVKIHGGQAPLPPAADANDRMASTFIHCLLPKLSATLTAV